MDGELWSKIGDWDTGVAIAGPQTPETPDTAKEETRQAELARQARRRATGQNWGNCVLLLKQVGLLPNRRVTQNGFAATIPITTLAMQEGESAVVRTAEGGRTGHVVYVTLRGGQYISTVEGGYRNGVGRVVPISVIEGEVRL